MECREHAHQAEWDAEMREKEKQLEFNRRLIERKKRDQQIREEQAVQEYELCKLAEDEHANTSSVT